MKVPEINMDINNQSIKNVESERQSLIENRIEETQTLDQNMKDVEEIPIEMCNMSEDKSNYPLHLNEDKSLSFFWFDAHEENNGRDIYLFGKVWQP